MTTSNSLAAWIIPTLEITTIHRDNEPSIHVEHFFNIQELEKVALKLNETLLFCGARHFFNKPKTIYPKTILLSEYKYVTYLRKFLESFFRTLLSYPLKNESLAKDLQIN